MAKMGGKKLTSLLYEAWQSHSSLDEYSSFLGYGVVKIVYISTNVSKGCAASILKVAHNSWTSCGFREYRIREKHILLSGVKKILYVISTFTVPFGRGGRVEIGIRYLHITLFSISSFVKIDGWKALLVSWA
jgi:hypothetical protein